MRELLGILPKPSRYVGLEDGAVHKDPQSVDLRIGLAFPDLYEVGMSYLGQKILYGLVNEHPRRQAERVFAPCAEAGSILRRLGAPLATLESDTPLKDLDAIGFSVTHELCYSNVLYMLDLAGIPLRAEARGSGSWPVVMAGGGCTLAAEPLAPFMDLMFLGEGEEQLPEFLDLLEQAKNRKAGRNWILENAIKIPGVYAPEFFAGTGRGAPRPLRPDYSAITRRVVADFDRAFYPVRQAVPFGAVHNRLALEIGRGCTRGCRFCQAGIIYRPSRERKVENLNNLVAECLAGTGYDDLSFLSLSSGDFSALKTLFMSSVDRCAAEQVSVSLPSLRVGSIDDEIMARMAGIRRTGATLAPEAGSQRLRDVINKGVAEEDLILHVQKLFEHGWQQVKLYFMIGLPTETDEDLLAIIDLCRKARDAAGPGVKRLQITASISPFVPKAHTPFQWEAQISLEEIRRRIGVLLQAVKSEKRIKLRWHEPEMSLLEGVFSRGDRRLANVVERAYGKGAIFASWMDQFSLAPWLEALNEEGLTPEEFTGARGLEEPLPWEHLRSGASREFLLRERANALKGKTVPDCRYGACQACGVCDTRAAKSNLDVLPGSAGYQNTLNFPRRDQLAHQANLDARGRVIVKDAGPRDSRPGPGRPPELAGNLGHKAAHFRLWYEKLGPAVFLSQLELQSLFERAFRKAGLPLSFSQGFHPLPLLSFARALPVGVASQGEWMCAHLREPLTPEQVFRALAPQFPTRLRLTRVQKLPVNQRPAEAVEEEFLLEYLGKYEKSFAEALDALNRAEKLEWARETKKGLKTLDIRNFFDKVEGAGSTKARIVLNWSAGYLSPAALCRAALGLALASDGDLFAPQDLFLTKIARQDNSL